MRDILDFNRTSDVIKFYDQQIYYDNNEYLIQKYTSFQGKNLMSELGEYYKYHVDIPRLFMLPTTNILNQYLDKKRKLEFKKLQEKMDKEEKINRNLETRLDNYSQMLKYKDSDTIRRKLKKVLKQYLQRKSNKYKKKHILQLSSISNHSTIKDLNSQLGNLIISVGRDYSDLRSDKYLDNLSIFSDDVNYSFPVSFLN